MAQTGDLIAGRQPVGEALAAGVPITEILVAEGAHAQLDGIISTATDRGIAVRRVPRHRLDRLADGVVHQGVVALSAPYRYAALGDILAGSLSSSGGPVLVADGVTDPRNLGSLIRVADAAGAAGLVIPERRASGVTVGARKSSAGAAEHVAIARVPNLTRAVEEAKSAGVWVIGLDDAATATIYDVDLAGPIALVVGAEGKGISRLVKENCDLVTRIPMHGRVSSLNVAQAAAVALFEWRRRRQEPEGGSSSGPACSSAGGPRKG